MQKKLDEILNRHKILSESLASADIASDPKKFAAIAKEHASISEIAEKIVELKAAKKDVEFAKVSISTEKDSELKKLFYEEIETGEKKITELEEEIKLMILGRDEDDEKSAIVEIRAGAGGEESGLFAAQLKRMYELFAAKMHLAVEEIDTDFTGIGGIKETVFMIKGKNVFSLLKFESGVHRVQRVPETESQGRIHTSTVTVAVLAERENLELEIDEKDLRIDTYRSGGAGGQHVNKTDSAVRITHLPTGLVVACQQERSQLKNKDLAMKILKNKLFDFFQTKADKEYAEKRKIQIGTGDRSEKIRTYNFPQNRVTDHRIGFSMFSIEEFMNGEILELVHALQDAEKKRRVESSI